MDCKNSDKHQEHICQLKLQQKFDEVRKLSHDATHFCKVCESSSSDPDTLCDPQKYKGKSGVLKWKS